MEIQRDNIHKHTYIPWCYILNKEGKFGTGFVAQFVKLPLVIPFTLVQYLSSWVQISLPFLIQLSASVFRKAANDSSGTRVPPATWESGMEFRDSELRWIQPLPIHTCWEHTGASLWEEESSHPASYLSLPPLSHILYVFSFSFSV